MQPFARLHHPGIDQFFIETAHCRELLGARQLTGFRPRRGLDDHHEPHPALPFPSSCLKDERTFAAPTCRWKFFPELAARSGPLPLAAHERTVTVGRAEINVD